MSLIPCLSAGRVELSVGQSRSGPPILPRRHAPATREVKGAGPHAIQRDLRENQSRIAPARSLAGFDQRGRRDVADAGMPFIAASTWPGTEWLSVRLPVGIWAEGWLNDHVANYSHPDPP